MGLPNAPTAYTDVCRRWRVPVRHSGRFSGVAAAASTAVVVGGRLGYRAYEDHRTAMARGTCVSAAADLDRAAKECRNPLGADATKSARPSSIIQIDRNLLETKLDRLVAEKVTEPLNAMPGASGRRDRQRRQIRVFSQVVTFLNSNMRYITNLPGENAECLFHGPVEVFEHISGVPPVIVMDNACLSSNKSACREVVTFC